MNETHSWVLIRLPPPLVPGIPPTAPPIQKVLVAKMGKQIFFFFWFIVYIRMDYNKAKSSNLIVVYFEERTNHEIRSHRSGEFRFECGQDAL
jgi:hypothetical protein